jgi:D-xylose transport system substrate-binding protein
MAISQGNLKSVLACSVFAISIAQATGAWSAEAAGKVYFLLPNTTTIRFESRDAPLFVEAMKKLAPKAQVIVQNGQGDQTRQQRLVEDAISQGAKVIVLTSSDSNLAAGSLDAAAKAHVPVVLYDHDAVGGPAAAHVVFDSLSVGKAQGERATELIAKMGKDVVRIARIKGNQGEYGTTQYEAGQNFYLDPLIKAGKVKIVCEQYTQNWDQVKAQSFAEDCLTRTSGGVDMFLGMNDGTTGGAVAALISQGYKKGQIAVTGGQDATVEALRFIAQGWQDNSVLKDLKLEANGAAEIVTALLEGKDVPKELINGKVNNTFMDVPARFLPVSNITGDNLEDVVKAGVWTWKEICTGIESAPACKGKS